MKKINLKKQQWNLNEYQDYLGYLQSLRNEKYKEFHSKLVTTKYEILGISLPIQRKIAKEICLGNILSFLEWKEFIYYEEVLIHGLVLAFLQDSECFQKYLEAYVPFVDNWGISDSFCNSLKIVLQDKEKWFFYFAKYLTSQEEFRIRIGLVVFLNFYVEKKYLCKIFSCIDAISSDAYYVDMAIAWLLCECYIAFPKETLAYLRKSSLNTFTFQKTMSKINDSYRVSSEEKKYLKNMAKELKK